MRTFGRFRHNAIRGTKYGAAAAAIGAAAQWAYRNAPKAYRAYNAWHGTRDNTTSDPSGSSYNVPGYTQRRTMYRQKHRKGWKRRMFRTKRFNTKVEQALESTLMSKNNYTITSTSCITGAYGFQQYNTVLHECSYYDLNTLFGFVEGGAGTQSGYGWSGAAGIATLPSTKLDVVGYNATITMKNQTNATVIVDLYTCHPRTDLAADTTYTASLATSDQGAQVDTLNIPGTTPYQVSQFTSNYKISRKVRYVLGPGAVEVVEYHDRKRKHINNERLQRNTNAASTYRGWSKQWFAVCVGEPTNDSTSKLNIATAPFKVDFITSETYWYVYAVENLSRMYVTNNQASVTTGDSILIDTGAVVAPTFA